MTHACNVWDAAYDMRMWHMVCAVAREQACERACFSGESFECCCSGLRLKLSVKSSDRERRRPPKLKLGVELSFVMVALRGRPPMHGMLVIGGVCRISASSCGTPRRRLDALRPGLGLALELFVMLRRRIRPRAVESLISMTVSNSTATD